MEVRKKYLEKLITRAINSTSIHSIRCIRRKINNDTSVKKIIELATQVKKGNGGYIRITKCGFRRGDAAEVSQLDFVK